MKCKGRLFSSLPLVPVLTLLALAPASFAQSAQPAPPAHAVAAPLTTNEAKRLLVGTGPRALGLPLFFEANQGQTDSQVKFLTRSKGYTLFLTPTETVLAESGTRMIGNKEGFGAAPEFKSVPAGALKMQLIGANPAPTMRGSEELPGKLNYLMGNDPAQWHTGVPLFSRVQTNQVYPGVNLVFHGNERALEYDFVVAPGADPNQVAFRIRGAKRIEIDSRGDLVLHTAASEFRMHKPVIYQADGASRKAVDGGFILSARNEVRFQLGAYDRTRELVIDPAIGFSSFLGGAGFDIGNGFVVDDSTPGSPKLYISGETSDSASFTEPKTIIGSGTSTTAPIVTEVGFVAKIDPTATGAASLIYLTFIGGKVPFQAADNGCGSALIWVALDKTQGAANVQPVLGAETTCSDYPTTTTINQVTAPTQKDFAVVATRLTANGGAVDKSALIGGNDQVTGSFVSVGIGGEVLIAGATSATNLPVKNPYVATLNNGNAGFADCFVAKLERSDLAATYLTYTNTGGGSTKTKSSGCGAFDDSSGNILAGGNTISATAFNLGPGGASLANGFEPTFPANATEATWAMKLNPNLSGINQLVFATYFAGGGMTAATNGAFDLGNGVVAIVGRTNSNTAVGDIPLKNAFQTQNKAAANNGQTGYLLVGDTTKTGAASLLCATYFGGSSGSDIVGGVGYDAGDPTNFRILLSGQTRSTDFPVMHEIQPYVGASGSPDGFVSVLSVPLPGQAFAASLVFSTYIGGSNPPAQINTVPPTIVEDDRITGVGVDSNHTIYAVGNTNSPQGFFANTNPATTVNGFQTACASCSGSNVFDDVVIFSIKTGGSATLDSIAVTPTAATISTGQTQQFHAVGNYSDGTEQDLTNTVAWSTVPGGIATMSTVTPGLAMGVAPGVTAVTPTLGSTPVLNNGSLTVTGSAVATHFSVSAPAAATAGTAFNFTVTAQDAANNTVTTFADTVNFSSTDGAAILPNSDVPLMHGVGNFQATLNTVGPQTITVTDANTASIKGTSNTITVTTVTGPTLVSIAVTPNPVLVNVGGANQLAATGIFSDSSQQDLTNTATWSSSDTTIATVSTTGLAMGVKAGGPVTIQAAQSGIVGSTSLTVTAPFTGPYQLGQLFASLGNGSVAVFKSDGTLLGTIDTGQVENAGLAFDATGNLYVTTFSSPTGVVKIDTNGKLVGPFGSGYTGNPESIVFSLIGNAIVGEAQTSDPTNPAPVPILEFDGTGNLIATFEVARQDRGTDWVELEQDQKTLLYTSEGTSIKSFDISKNLQNADFATNLPGSSAYALRQLPDGTVLVADTTAALRLTSTGAIQTTYTPNPAPQNLFALNLDPDGTSFWTADLSTGTIYRFDIASGTQLTSFTAPSSLVSGLAIFREKAPGANNIMVAESGTGSGTVTSQPAGIHCPTVCVAPFSDNSAVTLTASASAGSSFGGFSPNCTPSNPQTTPPSCTVSLGTSDVSVTVTFNVGTPVATHFLVSAPASATAGTSFNFLVTAQDSSNQTVTTYAGTVHFTSTDGAAILPANATLTSGVGTFPATLKTVGPRTITATDTVTPSITGASNTITVSMVSPPALSITKSHVGSFTQGQQGAHYTVTVLNGPNAGPTSGTVTVTETAPAGLTLASMAGTGWTCGAPNPANVCTRAGVLNGDANYPTITVTVNVAGNATSPQVNQVGVTGGGSAAASTNDSTTIVAATPPILQIAKSHTGNFTQGQQGAKYTVTVSTGDAGSTNGTAITVTDTVPAGLTLVSMAGTGWTCGAPNPANVCTRADVLSANANYPAITVTVNVLANATSPQLNQVNVSGGGATAAANASDSTVITPIGPAVLTITKTHGADFTLGQQGAQYTVTVTNGANAGPTTGVVTVTDAIPDGLTLVSMAGTGWTCPANSCTRSDALAAGASYPSITVTVNVSATAPAQVTNTVTVTGGGSTAANANDPTNVNAVPFTLVITLPAGGNPGAPIPISPGGQLALGLVLTPISTFTGTVDITVTSSPAGFLVTTAAPNKVKISVGGTQVAIVINTFCPGAVPANGPLNGPGGIIRGPIGALTGALEMLLAALALGSMVWTYRRRSRWVLSFAVLMLMALGSAACNNLPKGPNGGATPPGNYTLFIKATANGQSAVVQVPIQVLP